MQTFATFLAAGMAPRNVVNGLVMEARPWLKERHAWNKVKNPISALTLSLYRIGWTLEGATT
eukprot:7857301-Pyramimonas_sp.AAC.1